MNRRGFLTLSAAAVAPGSLWAADLFKGDLFKKSAAAKAPPPAIQWTDNLHQARDIAVRENRPMLLVFGAPWCVFCKKLERQTLAHPEMAPYLNSHFVPVHLDLDREADQKVAKILEVENLPCTVILSPNADLLGRIEGYHQPQAFYQQLTAAERRGTTLPASAETSVPR